MKIHSILILIVFVGIALFSFSMMGHGENSNGNCAIAALQGFTCPGNNALAFADFHLGALKVFSSASVGQILASVFALIAFMALALYFSSRALIPNKILNFYVIQDFFPADFPIKRQLLYWLSIHENSPALI